VNKHSVRQTTLFFETGDRVPLFILPGIDHTG
jgi:hypothetical protein